MSVLTVECALLRLRGLYWLVDSGMLVHDTMVLATEGDISRSGVREGVRDGEGVVADIRAADMLGTRMVASELFCWSVCKSFGKVVSNASSDETVEVVGGGCDWKWLWYGAWYGFVAMICCCGIGMEVVLPILRRDCGWVWVRSGARGEYVNVNAKVCQWWAGARWMGFDERAE